MSWRRRDFRSVCRLPKASSPESIKASESLSDFLDCIRKMNHPMVQYLLTPRGKAEEYFIKFAAQYRPVESIKTELDNEKGTVDHWGLFRDGAGKAFRRYKFDKKPHGGRWEDIRLPELMDGGSKFRKLDYHWLVGEVHALNMDKRFKPSRMDEALDEWRRRTEAEIPMSAKQKGVMSMMFEQRGRYWKECTPGATVHSYW